MRVHGSPSRGFLVRVLKVGCRALRRLRGRRDGRLPGRGSAHGRQVQAPTRPRGSIRGDRGSRSPRPAAATAPAAAHHDVRADGDLIITVCDSAHEELGELADLH